MVPIWWTDFGTKDISLGIHICWKGRVDFHILTGMLSLGRIPLYDNNGKEFALSNSFHESTNKRDYIKKRKPFRAGNPAL